MATYREDPLAYQRERRKLTGNAATKKYEKTKRGFLMRAYRNMQSRISGVQKQKHHLYEGLELLSRSEFYDWAMRDMNFHELFIAWEACGYERKRTPSVDRIDSKVGYVISNMEWVTHSENSRRGTESREKMRMEMKEATSEIIKLEQAK